MAWYFFAFLAPALWAVSNHIDKYVLNRYLKNGSIGVVVIFGGIVGFIFSLLIFIFTPHRMLVLNPFYELVIIGNGILLIAAMIPYFYALAQEETSMVVPLYQTVPIFSFILGFFILGETISPVQISAGLLIIIGAVFISLDLENVKIKKRTLLLMLSSSFMVAVYVLVFKVVAVKENFWGSVFYEEIGVMLAGLFLFAFMKNYRNQFIIILKKNRVSVISINGFNELVNIGAKLLVNYASLLAPIALITVANGLQPFFVFLYGIVLTLLFPSFAKETLEKKYIAQKLSAIAVMLLGTYLLIFA